MTRFLAIGVIVALAACTPLRPADVAPTTGARPAIGPEVIVRFSPGRRSPRALLEQVAARCWLDGVVRGAGMIVDRQTGRIVIAGETRQLLAADFLRPEDGKARIRLSGPVIADPNKQNRLVETLDLAARTGETGCPRITS